MDELYDKGFVNQSVSWGSTNGFYFLAESEQGECYEADNTGTLLQTIRDAIKRGAY
jgi:hypothetical protein